MLVGREDYNTNSTKLVRKIVGLWV